jgi:hypothetical protein
MEVLVNPVAQAHGIRTMAAGRFLPLLDLLRELIGRNDSLRAALAPAIRIVEAPTGSGGAPDLSPMPDRMRLAR